MSFMDNVTRFVGKAKLTGKKYEPEILLAVGIASGAACVFFACKGTLKASEIIDKHNERMEEINQLKEINAEDPTECTDRDIKVNTVRAYYATALDFAKTFGPAVIFGTLSLACILTSHGVMRKRNLALAASLATVRTAFDEYRGRVVRDLGKDMDRHFLYDTVEEIRESEVTDAETGKTKKVKEKVIKPRYANAYSRIFDNANAPDDFEKDGAANYMFIRAQMLTAQRRLIRDGYLFLNDVYKLLGMPITLAGQTAGWIYDYDNRDNTMIFFEGFDENELYNSQEVIDLMNGKENSIIINFLNIRDTILDDLPRVDSSIDVI